MSLFSTWEDRRYRYIVVLASFYLILVANGGLFLLVVALKQIAQDFSWPRSVPSLAYALLYIGSGVGGIVMGYWYDRSGVAPVVLLGTVMIGLGAVLGSYVSEAWHLYMVYGLMMGLLGQATIYGPLMLNIMSWFKEKRGFAVGMIGAGQSVAGALWPPVFRHFNETASWRETFLGFGLFLLATGLPAIALLWFRKSRQEKPNQTTASAGISIAPTLGLPPWVLQGALCLAIVGCCVSMSMPIAHLVSHASDLGHPTARAAEMLSLALFTTFFVRLVAGALLVDRFGGLTALFVFSATQAAALALYASVDGLYALYLVSFIFGLGYGGINLCYPVIVQSFFPAGSVGRRLGVVLLFGALGMAIGGWLAGYIFDLTGSYSPAFWAGVGFNVMNLLIIFSLIKRERGFGPKLAPA